MKDVFLLTKVLLKGSKTQVSGKKSKKIGTYFLIIFAYVYIMGFMAYLSKEIVTALAEFNVEFLFLRLSLIAAFALFVMQTLIAALNILFFSKDIEALLPLPLNPYKIVMAKMNCLLVSEYIMSLLFIVPVIVTYGYVLEYGISYFLMAIAALLLLPVVPVIVISLIVTLIMKVTNLIKDKNVVQYLSIILSLVLVFGIQAISNNTTENVTTQEITEMVVSLEEKTSEYTALYAPIKPIYEMLNNHDNVDGIRYLGISFVLNLLVYLIGTKIVSTVYLKIITSVKSGGKKSNKKLLRADYNKSSIKKAFIDRDYRILKRNPNFYMQCLLLPFIMPIIIFGSMWYSLSEMPVQDFEFILGYINSGYAFSIIVAVISLFYAFNYISVTAYSRDGSDAKVLKYIPVKIDKQISYKTYPGIKQNIFVTLLMLIALKLVVNTLSIVNLILAFAICYLISVLNNYFAVLIDLKNPKLHWVTEQAVVKQNFNMIIQKFLIVIQLMGIVGLGFKLQNLNQIVIILTFVYLILIGFVKLYIKKKQNKLYEKID